ncbi:MAG: hypothetical protein ACRC9K_12125 [Afipia sp.]
MADSRAKNIWTIYGPDGQLIMSNRVYDDPDGRYGHVLHERGMKFHNHAGKHVANLGRQFFEHGRLRDLRPMRIGLSRDRIGIGEANGATLTNVPIGAQLTILADGVQFYPLQGESGIVEGRKIDISAPVPGTYTLVITKFPYLRWERQVIAE